MPEYLDTKEVFDAGEACWLVTNGWKVLEHCTISRWSQGYHSETSSYILALPSIASRDVAAVSLSLIP